MNRKTLAIFIIFAFLPIINSCDKAETDISKILLSLLLGNGKIFSTAQWAQTTIAGSESSIFESTSVAPDGSVYAAGFIGETGTYDFGNGVTAKGAFKGYNCMDCQYALTGGRNLLLVKYNSSGIAQWARTVIAGNGNSCFFSVSVASDGSVYAAGEINGTGTYDLGNGVSAKGVYWHEDLEHNDEPAPNIVLVKYNSSGIAQWARTTIAGNSYSVFNSVSVASDGSIYAAGTICMTSTFDFGNGVTAKGIYSASIILVKYDSFGQTQWARTVIAGNNSSAFYSVSVASDGSVYAAGEIYGTGTFDFGNGATAKAMSQQSEASSVILVKYLK